MAPVDADGCTEATADSTRVWYAVYGTVHVLHSGEGELAILQWRHYAEAGNRETGLVIPPSNKMGFSASARRVECSARFSPERGGGGVVTLGKPHVDDAADVALYRFFARTAHDLNVLCDMIGLGCAGSAWRIAPLCTRASAPPAPPRTLAPPRSTSLALTKRAPPHTLTRFFTAEPQQDRARTQ